MLIRFPTGLAIISIGGIAFFPFTANYTISWVADILNPVSDRINMIYRIFEHMVHENMRLECFTTCINPVNLVNPVENAICGASCKYSQSATQLP